MMIEGKARRGRVVVYDLRNRVLEQRRKRQYDKCAYDGHDLQEDDDGV